jgi:hypothetical protein
MEGRGEAVSTFFWPRPVRTYVGVEVATGDAMARSRSSTTMPLERLGRERPLRAWSARCCPAPGAHCRPTPVPHPRAAVPALSLLRRLVPAPSSRCPCVSSPLQPWRPSRLVERGGRRLGEREEGCDWGRESTGHGRKAARVSLQAAFLYHGGERISNGLNSLGA